VDRWLSAHGGVLACFELKSLLCDLNSATNPSAGSEQKLPHESDLAWDSPQKRAAMRSLSFIRAVLWVADACSATDISEIWNSDVGRRIVQIL